MAYICIYIHKHTFYIVVDDLFKSNMSDGTSMGSKDG